MRFPCIAVLFFVFCAVAFGQAPNGESYSDEEFFDDFEGGSLNTSNWLVATWPEHGGQTGRERCFVEDGLLHMHLINSSSDGILNSAMQTRQEFFYGKWEMRAKPSSVPGVLNSFFTIDWDNTAEEGNGDGTKQEIDIEFLTKSFGGDEGQVHLALHAHDKPSWDTRPDIDLGFNPSEDFHIYGFEITPDYVEWFADDHVLYRYEYSENPVTINAPYALKLNTWTAEEWIGGPPEEDVVCDYQIDWIRFTPHRESTPVRNSTDKRQGHNPLIIDRDGLTLSLDQNSPVHFALYDASGRIVLERTESMATAGLYNIEFEDDDATGIHFYSLQAQGKRTTGKVMGMR